MDNQLLANKLGVLGTITDRLLAEAIGDWSPSSAAALLTLHYHGPSTVTGLARILGLSQPAASRLVERLVDQRLVARGAYEDARETSLNLTREGGKMAKALQARRLAGIAALTEALNESERQILSGLLDRMLAVPVTDRAYARHVCRFCDHRLCDGEDCPVGCAATALEHQRNEKGMRDDPRA